MNKESLCSRTDHNDNAESSMPCAAVNGQNLYYEGSGASGPTAVFSHRLLMNRTLFGERFGCIADAAISLDRAQDMAARRPDAEWVLIADAGHAPPISRIRSR